MKRMEVPDWARFLANTSAVLAWAWERQFEEGFSCDASVGAFPAAQGAEQLGWGASIRCVDRKPGEPTPENPARIVVQLEHGLGLGPHGLGRRAVQSLVFATGDGFGEGAADYLSTRRELMNRWADLLRENCLAGV
jgi:hypothetical protein